MNKFDSLEKSLALLVEEKVDRTVHVTEFDISDRLVSLWEHVEAWSCEDELGWLDGQFTGLGAHWATSNVDDVTSLDVVEGLEPVEGLTVEGFVVGGLLEVFFGQSVEVWLGWVGDGQSLAELSGADVG